MGSECAASSPTLEWNRTCCLSRRARHTGPADVARQSDRLVACRPSPDDRPGTSTTWALVGPVYGQRPDLMTRRSRPLTGGGLHSWLPARLWIDYHATKRVWFNGRTSASQADDVGSIPITRSNPPPYGLRTGAPGAAVLALLGSLVPLCAFGLEVTDPGQGPVTLPAGSVGARELSGVTWAGGSATWPCPTRTPPSTA